MLRRLAVLFALGFASGLPYLLTQSTLSAWLTSLGVPLETLGLLTLVTLPYSLKPLWAPLLDRYVPPLFGRRRGWMLVFQLLTAAAIALLATTTATATLTATPTATVAAPLSPATLQRLALLALLITFASASQDIVSDAYRTDLLAPAERPAGTATYVLGYRVAMLIAGGVALILADHVPWPRVYLGLGGALVVVGGVATMAAPEPPATTPPPSLRSAVIAPWQDFFRRRRALALLSFIVVFRLGDLVLNTMVMPFLLGLDFTRSEVGVVYKVAGISATIAGVLGGGVIVSRLGLVRALGAFTVAQGVAALGYAALALAGKQHTLLIIAVALEQLCAGACIAALDVLIMALCERRHSATQFALLIGASSLGGRLLGAGSGFAARALGWPLFFVAAALLALPVVTLLGSIAPELSRVEHEARA